jgi:hypothetical protein
LLKFSKDYVEQRIESYKKKYEANLIGKLEKLEKTLFMTWSKNQKADSLCNHFLDSELLRELLLGSIILEDFQKIMRHLI